MRINIPGMLLGAAIGLVLMGLFPLYQLSIYNQVAAQEQALAYARNLIDEVIDTRKLSEDTLEDFYLDMGSVSSNLSARIYRETRIINPDPLVPGKTYTTFMHSDDIHNYNQGDRFIVEVEQIGSSFMEKLAFLLMNLHVEGINFTLVGRVR